jgi:2-keto-3-deoxy-L-rhamnonate aldolase RhmA
MRAAVRGNRLRARLHEGGVLVGTFLNFPDPSLVEFTGLAGFDWVLIDAEHEGIGVATCCELVRAADAVGLATVVRVPHSAAEVVLGYAECGVDAVLGPHIDSAQAARDLVAALAYPPRGVRGFSASSRAANYGLTQQPLEYLEASGEHTLPIALLEDDAAMGELDAICKVDGLEVFTIGPGDLAASMGYPGRPQEPAVRQRIGDMTAELVARGKHLMLAAPTGEAARAAVEAGARLVVTSNAALLRDGMRAYLDAVRAVAEA